MELAQEQVQELGQGLGLGCFVVVKLVLELVKTVELELVQVRHVEFVESEADTQDV